MSLSQPKNESDMTTADIPLNASLQSLIGARILWVRDQRTMLDSDLAELYGVQTKVLVQSVKRNLTRFPQDFMFQLTADEFAVLRSQIVTSNTGQGGRRTAPCAFTEQGAAMLSPVLGSPRAPKEGGRPALHPTTNTPTTDNP
jgi:hypothetical protein